MKVQSRTRFCVRWSRNSIWSRYALARGMSAETRQAGRERRKPEMKCFFQPRDLWVSEVSAAIPEVSAAVCVSLVPAVDPQFLLLILENRDDHSDSRERLRRLDRYRSQVPTLSSAAGSRVAP